MKHFYLISILFLGLITACNSTKTNDIHFPKEETLIPELMPLQGITDPPRVEIKHPFLIIQNSSKMKDSVFHIYDLTTNKLKNAFGVIGEGPKEFALPWMVQTYLPDLIIVDKHSFNKYRIDKNGQPELTDSIEPQYINYVNEAAFINDSLFVIDAQYTGPYIHLCSMQDEVPKKSWKYRNPNMVDYYADPNMGMIYANESRIIFCYGYKKQIDFMDTEFNLIKSVKFDYNTGPVITPVSSTPGEDKRSYVHSYLGKHYLYALFFGMTWNEYEANLTCNTFLEVFDLDGNPVVKYQLKGRRPVYFAVDEETFTLYGTGDHGNPEDNLLVYKLKGLS